MSQGEAPYSHPEPKIWVTILPKPPIPSDLRQPKHKIVQINRILAHASMTKIALSYLIALTQGQ